MSIQQCVKYFVHLYSSSKIKMYEFTSKLELFAAFSLDRVQHRNGCTERIHMEHSQQLQRNRRHVNLQSMNKDIRMGYVQQGLRYLVYLSVSLSVCDLLSLALHNSSYFYGK